MLTAKVLNLVVSCHSKYPVIFSLSKSIVGKIFIVMLIFLLFWLSFLGTGMGREQAPPTFPMEES